MIKIRLKPKREQSVLRRHPWIFSGGIAKIEGEPADGDLVEVYSSKGEWLAIGHYQQGSIMVRIISFEPTDAGLDFWITKLRDAWEYRRQLGLVDDPQTDCFRLLHAEGDQAPGLIIDLYGKTAVLQCHSFGMYRQRHTIAEALQQVLGPALEAIYDKSAESLPPRATDAAENDYLLGSASTASEVYEHGHRFNVDWVAGQKTGFFLDQRSNRALLARFAPGKTVLNTFAYSGGFSIYALKAGATRVVSVDVSGKAIDLAIENAVLNGFDAPAHEGVKSDVLQYFKQSDEQFDLVVVDPPAYAKNLKKRHNAVQGYKRLNAAAFEKVKPGGLLFTFSCSQVVDRQLFYDTIVAAAQDSGRHIRVMHLLSQPADHPVSLYHPEGSYLKGLVLQVS
ncbi:MAG: class I SAM-dependent rRNA methyltransferase [Phaeodactylibacter sp.]|nr:class I SAM-dependent rRNA methyltransferase [Phaeodactylibacter sp.]